ncbi:hypothetical protein EON66_06755 [archaeon]|nr:MAG: hypothetical protein EON66_06755 [archaeon]
MACVVGVRVGVRVNTIVQLYNERCCRACAWTCRVSRDAITSSFTDAQHRVLVVDLDAVVCDADAGGRRQLPCLRLPH